MDPIRPYIYTQSLADKSFCDPLIVQESRSVHNGGFDIMTINPITRMSGVGMHSPDDMNDFDVEKSSGEDEVQVDELISIDPAAESQYVKFFLVCAWKWLMHCVAS